MSGSFPCATQPPRPRAGGRSGLFTVYQVGRPPRLAIFFNRAVHLKHQIGQRLISAEYIAMPQKPFYALKFFEKRLFGDQAFIGAAETPRHLRELAIGTDLAKDFAPLIGKTGVEFEREALLMFYNTLNEQRHLTGVMVGRETEPALRKFLETTKAQLEARYAKVGALLNRRYFTQ